MGLIDNIRLFTEALFAPGAIKQNETILRQQAEALVKEVAELQQELSKTKKELVECREDAKRFRAAQHEIEYRGAFFRRGPTGDIDPDPLCPVCRSPMVSLGRMLPFHCAGCNKLVNFTGRDLADVMIEVVKRFGVHG